MGLAAQERLQLRAAGGRFGDEPGVEGDVGGAEAGDVASGRRIGAEQILDMQNPDDVFGIAAPQRDAGVGRVERLAHQLGRGQIRLQRAHLGAMDHHIAHGDVLKLQQAAEHVALVARHLALAMQDVDRAAQLIRPRKAGFAFAVAEIEQPQQQVDEDLDRAHHRGEHGDEEGDDRRDDERHLIRVSDGDRFGQHLAEHDDQHRHHGGGFQHAALAEFLDEQARHIGRGGDGDELAAEQHGADQPAFVGDEAVGERGARVAGGLQRLKPRARGGRERRLRPGEEGGADEAENNDERGDGEGHRRDSTVPGRLNRGLKRPRARATPLSTPLGRRSAQDGARRRPSASRYLRRWPLRGGS
jgi:hypothetical protein